MNYFFLLLKKMQRRPPKNIGERDFATFECWLGSDRPALHLNSICCRVVWLNLKINKGQTASDLDFPEDLEFSTGLRKFGYYVQNRSWVDWIIIIKILFALSRRCFGITKQFWRISVKKTLCNYRFKVNFIIDFWEFCHNKKSSQIAFCVWYCCLHSQILASVGASITQFVPWILLSAKVTCTLDAHPLNGVFLR